MQSSFSKYAFTIVFPIFEINDDVFLRASSDFSAWGVSPLDCGWLGFRQYCCPRRRRQRNIPWTEEPGRLQSMGSLKGGQDWATSLSLFTSMHWRRKWQPTPVFLPGESRGRGSLVGCRLWGRTESDTTAVTQQQQLPRGVLVQVSNLCVSSRSLPFPTYQGDHPSPLVSQMFISPPLFPWPLPAAPSGPPLLQALLWFTRVSACPLGCSFHHYSFSYICRAVLNLEGPQSHLEGMLAPAPEFDSTGLG